MLFDLTSPGRRRIVRVVYGGLAAIFFIGFVFFGIGATGVGGSLIDALGIGGGGSGTSTAEQYEQQIEDAEDKLESDPANVVALTQLANYRVLSGRSQLTADPETGAPVLTDASRQEFEAAITAWSDYLETNPENPNVGLAFQILSTYQLLNDAAGAVEVQELIVEKRPSSANYAMLAFFRYADYDVPGGDEAADTAKEMSKAADREQLDEQLARYRRIAVKAQEDLLVAQEQLDELPEGVQPETPIENPFGNLANPSGLGAEPTAP